MEFEQHYTQPQGDTEYPLFSEINLPQAVEQPQENKLTEEDTQQHENQKELNFDFNFNTGIFQQFFLIDHLKIVFFFSNKLRQLKKLSISDLPKLRTFDDPDSLSETLINNLGKINLSKLTPSQMVFQLFKPLSKMTIPSIICYSFDIITFLTGSIFINLLLDSLKEDTKWTLLYLIILSLLLLLNSIVGNFGCKFAYGTAQQLRVLTMTALFKKINSLSQFTIKEANIGKLVNLVSNDFNSVEQNFCTLLISITLPISIIYTLIIIILRFSWLGLLSPLLLILSSYSSIAISNKFEYNADLKAQAGDERIKLCNEIIEGIRLIKMYAWEKVFQQLIHIVRMKELKYLVKMNIWSYLSISINNTSTYFIIALQLIVIHFYQGGLTTGKIISTIYLLQYLKDIVFLSGLGIFCFQSLKITSQRILDVFLLKNNEMQNINTVKEEISNGCNSKNVIEFKNFQAFWNSKENQLKSPKEPVLKNINLEIEQGTLTCIIGKIGSGKSSLLSCILQEIPTFSGQFFSYGNIAYVEQEPYIFSGTARDNILFGKKFIKKKYNQIVNLCCLEQDFYEFPNSDSTEIGERGINISGGQKARLSLARALYSDADIYLLDDPLSAVDSNVGRNIFNNVLKCYLKSKTVLLVTHQIPYTKDADQIVIIDQGQIKSKGTFAQLENELLSIIGQFKFEQNDVQFENEINQQLVTENTLNIYEKNIDKGKLLKDEDEQCTNVSINTYKRFYSSSQNYIYWLITLAFFCTPEIIFVYYTRYLSNYEQEQGEKEQEWVLIVAIILGLLYFCNYVIKYMFLVISHSKSIKNIHEKLVEGILRSKVIFFDQTQSGRILNAFSNDMGIIDNNILYCQCDFYEVIIGYVILLIASLSLNYWLAIVFFVQINILIAYISKIKEIIIYSRQIDLKHKSPIYTFFNTCIGGVLPIRIYKQQEQYTKQIINLAKNSLKASFLFTYCSRAFAFSVLFISMIFSLISIYITIYVYSNNENSDVIGNIILYLFFQTQSLQWGLRQKIQLDIGLSSAQRNFQLQDIPKEPDYENNQKDIILSRINFPNKGIIQYKNVQFRYRENLDLVLKGVNFTIESGQKIGCVGRTGSGKSTLLQVLFRMYDIENLQDSGIFIDGFNIFEYGLHSIRQKMSILPQTPFIFSGTIRRNLDPLQEYKDEELWQVLQEVKMKEFVYNLKDKLDTDMTQVNSVFSVGQKQLICLCRAILKKSKILVLDEATANIDMQTDELIQQKIKDIFNNCTILTIAHRLNTIADYDKVLVMDNGKIVEFDIPYRLLVKQIGDKEITNKNGVFAQLVIKSGEKNSLHIFEIAKNKFISLQ